MKKHGYTSFLIWGLLIGLAATTAQAQSKMKVNVPFDFTIGDRLLAAGEYTVQPASPYSNSQVLMFRDGDGASRALTMSIRIEPNSKVTQSKLVFHRYGESYFLSQVWLNAGDAGSEIRAGSHERELAKSGTARTLVAVLSEPR